MLEARSPGMAVYWNLGVFARDHAAVVACADYFRAQRLEVDGRNVELEISEAEVTGGWIVGVWPRGMSFGSPRGNDARLTADAAVATIAETFDAWLRDAPAFTLAFFGAEAYDSLLDGIGEIDEPFESLVFDTEMFAAFGQPAKAQRVRDGRYVIPRSPANG